MISNFKLLIIFFSLIVINLRAQSLTGITGMLNVPTAELLEDGEISFGASYLNKKYLPATFTNDDGLAYYVTVGFLPFAELSIRFTKRMAPIDALGDKMFSFRIRLVQEKEVIPSILIGIHDPFHSTEKITNKFSALYLATTKNIPLGKLFNNFKISFGYGTEMINASSHQFKGFFGGISFEFIHLLELIGEYDSQIFNTGVKLNLFNPIKSINLPLRTKAFTIVSSPKKFSFKNCK